MRVVHMHCIPFAVHPVVPHIVRTPPADNMCSGNLGTADSLVHEHAATNCSDARWEDRFIVEL